jgi:hypothetical protein
MTDPLTPCTHDGCSSWECHTPSVPDDVLPSPSGDAARDRLLRRRSTGWPNLSDAPPERLRRLADLLGLSATHKRKR